MGLLSFECSTEKEKSYDVVRRFLRVKIGHLLGNSLTQVPTSSKKHTSFDSSRKSKGSSDLSSIKKLHLATIKDSTPTSKFMLDKESSYQRLEEVGSKSNGFNVSRDKDETMDFRLKSEAMHKQDLFAFDEDGDDMETKRMNDIRDTPRLINFSMNSSERSGNKEPSHQQDQRLDKWMLAGGIKPILDQRIDQLSNQETKRVPQINVSQDRRLESNVFRELPPQPPSYYKRQDEQEEYRFIQTGATHILSGADCISTPRIRDNYNNENRMKEIDKEIENLERSMDRISKSSLHIEFKDEHPYNSRVTPTKQPSPPSHNIFNQNVFAIEPLNLANKYTAKGSERNLESHLPVFNSGLGNHERPDAFAFHTFKNPGQHMHNSQDFHHSSKGKVVMRLDINDTEIEVFSTDNSEKIARRYFMSIGSQPSKKDLQRLREVIAEKVNKKIDYLEKLFRRTISIKETSVSSQVRTASIDLSNKENRHPNIMHLPPAKSPKPPLMERKNSSTNSQTSIWKSTSRSKFESNTSIAENSRSGYAGELQKKKQLQSLGEEQKSRKNSPRLNSPSTSMTYSTKSNKSVQINVKKDDNPYELARIILLQRGLGLANVDKLAENIKQFQIRTYGAKNLPKAS